MKLRKDLMKDARDRKGLTVDEMSKATGFSVPTILRAENGLEIFNSTGRRLCEFLGVDLNVVVVPRSERDGDAA